MYQKLSRAEKAQRILAAGLVHATHVETGDYVVDSESRTGLSYRVNILSGTCECQDYVNGHTCKHILSAEQHAAQTKAAIATAPKPEPVVKLTLADLLALYVKKPIPTETPI